MMDCWTNPVFRVQKPMLKIFGVRGAAMKKNVNTLKKREEKQMDDMRFSFYNDEEDEPVLLVYRIIGGSMFGGEPSVKIVKVHSGQKAIELYSELTGKENNAEN